MPPQAANAATMRHLMAYYISHPSPAASQFLYATWPVDDEGYARDADRRKAMRDIALISGAHETMSRSREADVSRWDCRFRDAGGYFREIAAAVSLMIEAVSEIIS